MQSRRGARRSGVRGVLRRRGGDPTHTEGPVPRRRTTLIDPELQQRFERDGYVVVDLLDAAAVQAVTERYQAMDHERRVDFDWVQGFSTSIYDARPGYRSEVLDIMEELVAPRLDRVLDRHAIMWANFLVKDAGADRVPPHVDWTFLDESRYSSATVWCPLADTDDRNGTLGVVRGSHHRIDFLRPSNVPTFERCELAVADMEDRPIIPVRAGQAIIMDNRVVHFSPPNSTERGRVAVGCVVGPTEAELHHYWMDEDEQLLRFDIERDFYLTYVIGESPYEASGVLGAGPAR